MDRETNVPVLALFCTRTVYEPVVVLDPTVFFLALTVSPVSITLAVYFVKRDGTQTCSPSSAESECEVAQLFLTCDKSGRRLG